MKRYKYTEQEEMIKDLKTSNLDDRYWLYSQIIAEMTSQDDTATDLARKVLRGDIENMLDKIQSLYQRSSCNCDGTEGKTNIDLLIEWLEYINPDEF